MKLLSLGISFLLAAALPLLAQDGEPTALFDGTSFEGWNFADPAEEEWWEIRDGMIVGGSLERKVPRNFFLATDRSFQNFELTYKVRLVQGEGFANSGVQIRSIRQGHGMTGYQVDAGAGWWGKIYDEHRRNKVITTAVDAEATAANSNDWDWNEFRVLAEGERIRAWINGVLAFDYYEQQPNIPLDGHIGLQAHGGGKFEVQFKDIAIRELPPTPGAPIWENPNPGGAAVPTKAELVAAQKADGHAPRSPEEELAGFHLPEGFTAELVASEEQGVAKPITVQWDAQGRMWTMTAVEYPIDANENAASAEAEYASGGNDRILVFDDPYGPGPHTPREFATGLVIPLGLLPYGDGALVQYGTQIRHYHDRDGDGKAEGFEVVLDGFGIQDSHLFPHQFERAPGGWITLAQGLFNYSKVRRPDGQPFADGSAEIPFNQCKLARFRPDGRMFEPLTAGPNNIWGFVQTNDGETFLQEANDLGIPAAEYIRGTHYTTGSKDKLRSYAPQIPPSMPRVMGGTGLSGLALTEDINSPFNRAHPDRDRVFYVVNPITNRIQIISADRVDDGDYRWTKHADFLTSEDKSFRPVAAHFGPDGCLYIVDWYNKIISHNEVPRSHPDRDKSRGRIWRIRHTDQPITRDIPIVADLPEADLPAGLAHPNERVARFAWHEIADRGTPEVLAAPLAQMITDKSRPSEERVLALWSLEDMGALEDDHLRTISDDKNDDVRVQVVRALGERQPSEALFLETVGGYADDPSYRVRAELANTVRSFSTPTPAMIAAVARLGDPPLTTGTDRQRYHRDFERYLARWAMEVHQSVTAEMLESELAATLSGEERLLAIQSLDPTDAAVQLVRAAPDLGRPLTTDELALVSSQLAEPEVADRFAAALADPAHQLQMLRAMETIDAKIAANERVSSAVGSACEALASREPGHEPLLIRLATKFRIRAMEDRIAGWIEGGGDPAVTAAGLAALREMGSRRQDLFAKHYTSEDPEVRRAATSALASLDDPSVVDLFAKDWAEIPADLRQLVIGGLTSSEQKSEALASAILEGGFEEITGDSMENLIVALGTDHPKVKQILAEVPGLMQPVIVLDGNNRGIVRTNIDLVGPFTLETWVKLDEGIGHDDDILGASGHHDFNFYNGQFRIWAEKKDIIVAQRTMEANLWTHLAVTRDAAGLMRIFIDGELDAEAATGFTADIRGLNIGETNVPSKGAGIQLREMRVWDRERTAEEVLADLHTDYGSIAVDGLIHRVSGDTEGLEFEGGASASLVTSFPKLVTPEEAAAAKAKFERYLALANAEGNAATGQALFALCMACHKVGDAGGVIGPDLSGAGAMTTEALLHNILTPNAKMESGYYRHDLITTGGKVSGTLVEETATTFTILPAGGEARVIQKADVRSHNISKSSLMPEGLIDHLTDQQVSDLFAYLRSLGK